MLKEIDSINVQILNMKKHLSSIVGEYKFDSVQAFSKELNVSKREYFDYQAARTEWEKICGGKLEDSVSIRQRDEMAEKKALVSGKGKDQEAEHER